MQKIIGKDKFKKNFYERISDFFYFRLIELSPLKMILSSSFFKIKGNKKKFPTVLQLPITYKCNSKCKMCDIWKMKSSDEYSIEDFELLLRDPIFKEITSVGINGGEPSLLKNLPEYAKVIVKLPKISSLNIISNGFNQKLLLFYVEKIYQMCKIKKIKFHISISLDGYGEIHNIVRGKENAFEKTIATIDEIILNQEKYCDSLDLGCTIIQQNIDYLNELNAYAELKNFNVKYRLGVVNKRLHNFDSQNHFSVLNPPYNQIAKEFFHRLMSTSTNNDIIFKYFSVFYWLNNKKPRRLLGCQWKDEGITLDSRGNIYYCAVASEIIGNLFGGAGKDIFFSKKNIAYRKQIINNECKWCIHDYWGQIELRSLLSFFWYLFTENMSMKFYRIRCITGYL